MIFVIHRITKNMFAISCPPKDYSGPVYYNGEFIGLHQDLSESVSGYGVLINNNLHIFDVGNFTRLNLLKKMNDFNNFTMLSEMPSIPQVVVRKSQLSEVLKLIQSGYSLNIHGVPGIGKTQFACSIIKEMKDTNLIWIDASNKDKILKFYKKLFSTFNSKANISEKDFDWFLPQMENLENCLFVFDNINDELLKYTPNTRKLIISEKTSECPELINVKLDLLEPEDAELLYNFYNSSRDIPGTPLIRREIPTHPGLMLSYTLKIQESYIPLLEQMYFIILHSGLFNKWKKIKSNLTCLQVKIFSELRTMETLNVIYLCESLEINFDVLRENIMILEKYDLVRVPRINPLFKYILDIRDNYIREN